MNSNSPPTDSASPPHALLKPESSLAEFTVSNPSQNQEAQWPRGSETEERRAAEQRGRLARQHALSDTQALSNTPSPVVEIDPRLINTAVAALCENVRDYAIFVMDAEGVIVYWGMGAHLVKWWTKEEAEGAHLRLLYPEGGSEDGSAEAHLRESAQSGEYVGEGQRVRRDGSTFWAHVTLTALRDPHGTLLGFAKVTQDLTKRRATETAVALSNEAQTSRDAALMTAQKAQSARESAEAARLSAELARERAEEAAEFAREQARGAHNYIAQVLAPELATERAQRAALSTEVDAYAQLYAHRERQAKQETQQEAQEN